MTPTNKKAATSKPPVAKKATTAKKKKIVAKKKPADPLQALTDTKKALATIQERLAPVLSRLRNDAADDLSAMSDIDRAQALASVALATNMLRFMGARLRGQDVGRKPSDPIFQEINKVRGLISQIKDKRTEIEKTEAKAPKSS